MSLGALAKYQFSALDFALGPKPLKISLFKASIFDLLFNSRLSNSTLIHQFYYSASTRLRLQSLVTRLDNEFESGPRFVKIWCLDVVSSSPCFYASKCVSFYLLCIKKYTFTSCGYSNSVLSANNTF